MFGKNWLYFIKLIKPDTLTKILDHGRKGSQIKYIITSAIPNLKYIKARQTLKICYMERHEANMERHGEKRKQIK